MIVNEPIIKILKSKVMCYHYCDAYSLVHIYEVKIFKIKVNMNNQLGRSKEKLTIPMFSLSLIL